MAGSITNAITLNRYAYANGNPVSNVDPFGLFSWGTFAKFATGAIVITGLAVLTVATAGTATAIIAGAATASAAISGTASIVGGLIGGDTVDEIATSFMVGTIAGAASGTLTASGAPGMAVAAGNLAIDIVEYVAEESLDGDGECPTVGGAVSTAIFSLAPDLLPKFDFNLGKLVNLEFEAGWLRKGSSYYNELVRHDSVLYEFHKRKNSKYAAKQISESFEEHNDFVLKHWGAYICGSVWDEIKSKFIEPFREDFAQFIDENRTLLSRK